MNAMRSAVMVSRLREGQRVEAAALNNHNISSSGHKLLGGEITSFSIDWKESLYLATRGGALTLALPTGAGAFVVGAPFDAQLSE